MRRSTISLLRSASCVVVLATVGCRPSSSAPRAASAEASTASRGVPEELSASVGREAIRRLKEHFHYDGHLGRVIALEGEDDANMRTFFVTLSDVSDTWVVVSVDRRSGKILSSNIDGGF
jgi:hypothetical protein